MIFGNPHMRINSFGHMDGWMIRELQGSNHRQRNRQTLAWLNLSPQMTVFFVEKFRFGFSI